MHISVLRRRQKAIYGEGSFTRLKLQVGMLDHGGNLSPAG